MMTDRARLSQLFLRVQAGATGGVIAAVAVAALFLVQGAIQLHPLSTPAALATGFFGANPSGAGGTSSVTSVIVLGVEILAYTVIHVLTFAAVGTTAAFVLDGAAFWRSLWGGVAYAGIGCTGLLYGVRLVAGTPVALDVLGLPRVLLANALAGAIIGTVIYLVEHGEAPTAKA